MQTIVRNVLGVICGILIGAAVSACAGQINAPLVKWWFNDARDERALVRKECDDKDNCKILERLTYEQADGYYAISPVDWERRETYIKSLERNCK